MKGHTTLLLALAAGCNLGDPVGLDAGRDDAEAATDVADGAEEVMGEPDGDVGEGSGPITIVLDRIELLPERRCDLDGDGQRDNSIADLGEPLTTLLLGTLNAMVQGSIETGRNRLVFFFPWVDDRLAPNDTEAVLIVYDGTDTDDPPNPSDDFSGEEPFVVPTGSLDNCGEPRMYFDPVSITEGALMAQFGTLEIPVREDSTMIAQAATAEGSIARGGASLDLTICGYGLASDLGGAPGLEETEMSILETLVAGGAGVGIPSVPGVNPDVDVDGDGLERFLLDSDNRVERCVDGDGTVIEGVDCYLDARMADGFSLVITATGVPAAFAGREPGWEEEMEEAGMTCEPGPPEESLWEPE